MAVEFPMWVLGVILILLGSLGNNLGNNLVSLAHKETKVVEETVHCPAGNAGDATVVTDDDRYEKGMESGQNSPNTNGRTDIEDNRGLPQAEMLVVVKDCPKKKGMSLRTIGTLVFVFGNLFTFAAFGFGAQSLLASLESVQFVSNVVFAKYVHKEKITKRMLVATLSIVVGNVLVVLFSEHAAKLYTSEDLIYLYRHNTAYQAYLAIAAFLWFINHFTYRYYYKARIVQRRFLWNHSFVEPFTFTISSAIIGTQAVLLSKCMSMLIQVSAYGDNEFNRPTIFVVLVSWLILVAYWLRRLDLGLSLYPPLFIIPVMQVFFVFFAIMCGGIYFEEFVGYDSTQYSGFGVGVIMILGGVYGLAPTDVLIIPPSKDDDEAMGHTTSTSGKHLLENEFRQDIEGGAGPVRRNSSSGPERRNSGAGMKFTPERRGSEHRELPVRRGSAGGMVPLYAHLEGPAKHDDLFRALSPGGLIPELFGTTVAAPTSAANNPIYRENREEKQDRQDREDRQEQPYHEVGSDIGSPAQGGQLPSISTTDADLMAANKKKRKVVKRSPTPNDDGSSSPLIRLETVNQRQEYAL